jgi:hypothetical protein
MPKLVRGSSTRCREIGKREFLNRRRRAGPAAAYTGGNREIAALRLGIEPDHLSGLLSGDWARFTLDALAKLVRGYSVPVETLLWIDPGVALGIERGRECQ